MISPRAIALTEHRPHGMPEIPAGCCPWNQTSCSSRLMCKRPLNIRQLLVQAIPVGAADRTVHGLQMTRFRLDASNRQTQRGRPPAGQLMILDRDRDAIGQRRRPLLKIVAVGSASGLGVEGSRKAKQRKQHRGERKGRAHGHFPFARADHRLASQRI